MTYRLVSSTLLACSAVLFISSQSVAAGVDAAAAQALAKKNNCFKCHALDKTKKGRSYKKIAAKYTGKPEGESKLITNFTTGEGEDPEVKVVSVRRGRFALDVSCPIELIEKETG